jgi:hypothetical protein
MLYIKIVPQQANNGIDVAGSIAVTLLRNKIKFLYDQVDGDTEFVVNKEYKYLLDDIISRVKTRSEILQSGNKK